jgi:hypothetical protein
MKFLRINVLIITSLLILISCRKKNDYLNESDFANKSGSVSVTISGTSYDGIPLNENYTNEYYPSDDLTLGGFYETNQNLYYFDFFRSGTMLGSSNTIEFGIVTDGTSFQFNNFHIFYQKNYTNQQVLILNYSETDIVTFSVSNYSFNQTTGELIGNYNIVLNTGNTSQTKINVTGKFDVTVKRAVFK